MYMSREMQSFFANQYLSKPCNLCNLPDEKFIEYISK